MSSFEGSHSSPRPSSIGNSADDDTDLGLGLGGAPVMVERSEALGGVSAVSDKTTKVDKSTETSADSDSPSEDAPLIPNPVSVLVRSEPKETSETSSTPMTGSPTPSLEQSAGGAEKSEPVSTGSDSGDTVLAVGLEMVREVESVTSKAGEIASHAVVDFVATAGSEAAFAVQEIGQQVSTLGAAFSSWLGTSEPSLSSPEPKRVQKSFRTEFSDSAPASSSSSSLSAPSIAGEGGGKSQTGPRTDGAASAVDLQAIFGFPAEEVLMEAFSCRLLQLYSCTHNSFTPAIPKAFRGVLYLTGDHVGFHIEEAARKIPIALKKSELKRVSHMKARRKGEKDQLKIVLAGRDGGGEKERDVESANEEQWMIFQDFDSSGDVESALALLEHLLT